MRTTLDLADDVLLAAKELAQRQQRTAGAVISELARLGLLALQNGTSADAAQRGVSEPAAFYGFEPIPARGKIVSNSQVDALRDELGI